MVVDVVTQNVYLSPTKIRFLANRHSGVGFDQLLFVEPPYDPEIDFHYRIFNADGSEVTQCGNGARCLAHFVRMKKLTNKREIYISTQTSRMVLTIIENNMVRVNMGVPKFELPQIPFDMHQIEKKEILYLAKNYIFGGIVSIGNPHCIMIVNNVDSAQVSIIGPILEIHKYFSERTNVGFMQVINREQVLLRVYERGVGETQACGSGACAAVAIGIRLGLLAEQVQVALPGGKLVIYWRGPGQSLYMTGPAVHIYDGFIND